MSSVPECDFVKENEECTIIVVDTKRNIREIENRHGSETIQDIIRNIPDFGENVQIYYDGKLAPQESLSTYYIPDTRFLIKKNLSDSSDDTVETVKLTFKLYLPDSEQKIPNISINLNNSLENFKLINQSKEEELHLKCIRSIKWRNYQLGEQKDNILIPLQLKDDVVEVYYNIITCKIPSGKEEKLLFESYEKLLESISEKHNVPLEKISIYNNSGGKIDENYDLKSKLESEVYQTLFEVENKEEQENNLLNNDTNNDAILNPNKLIHGETENNSNEAKEDNLEESSLISGLNTGEVCSAEAPNPDFLTSNLISFSTIPNNTRNIGATDDNVSPSNTEGTDLYDPIEFIYQNSDITENKTYLIHKNISLLELKDGIAKEFKIDDNKYIFFSQKENIFTSINQIVESKDAINVIAGDFPNIYISINDHTIDIKDDTINKSSKGAEIKRWLSNYIHAPDTFIPDFKVDDQELEDDISLIRFYNNLGDLKIRTSLVIKKFKVNFSQEQIKEMKLEEDFSIETLISYQDDFNNNKLCDHIKKELQEQCDRVRNGLKISSIAFEDYNLDSDNVPIEVKDIEYGLWKYNIRLDGKQLDEFVEFNPKGSISSLLDVLRERKIIVNDSKIYINGKITNNKKVLINYEYKIDESNFININSHLYNFINTNFTHFKIEIPLPLGATFSTAIEKIKEICNYQEEKITFEIKNENETISNLDLPIIKYAEKEIHTKIERLYLVSIDDSKQEEKYFDIEKSFIDEMKSISSNNQIFVYVRDSKKKIDLIKQNFNAIPSKSSIKIVSLIPYHFKIPLRRNPLVIYLEKEATIEEALDLIKEKIGDDLRCDFKPHDMKICDIDQKPIILNYVTMKFGFHKNDDATKDIEIDINKTGKEILADIRHTMDPTNKYKEFDKSDLWYKTHDKIEEINRESIFNELHLDEIESILVEIHPEFDIIIIHKENLKQKETKLNECVKLSTRLLVFFERIKKEHNCLSVSITQDNNKIAENDSITFENIKIGVPIVFKCNYPKLQVVFDYSEINRSKNKTNTKYLEEIEIDNSTTFYDLGLFASEKWQNEIDMKSTNIFRFEYKLNDVTVDDDKTGVCDWFKNDFSNSILIIRIQNPLYKLKFINDDQIVSIRFPDDLTIEKIRGSLIESDDEQIKEILKNNLLNKRNCKRISFRVDGEKVNEDAYLGEIFFGKDDRTIEIPISNPIIEGDILIDIGSTKQKINYEILEKNDTLLDLKKKFAENNIEKDYLFIYMDNDLLDNNDMLITELYERLNGERIELQYVFVFHIKNDKYYYIFDKQLTAKNAIEKYSPKNNPIVKKGSINVELFLSSNNTKIQEDEKLSQHGNEFVFKFLCPLYKFVFTNFENPGIKNEERYSEEDCINKARFFIQEKFNINYNDRYIFEDQIALYVNDSDQALDCNLKFADINNYCYDNDDVIKVKLLERQYVFLLTGQESKETLRLPKTTTIKQIKSKIQYKTRNNLVNNEKFREAITFNNQINGIFVDPECIQICYEDKVLEDNDSLGRFFERKCLRKKIKLEVKLLDPIYTFIEIDNRKNKYTNLRFKYYQHVSDMVKQVSDLVKWEVSIFHENDLSRKIEEEKEILQTYYFDHCVDDLPKPHDTTFYFCKAYPIYKFSLVFEGLHKDSYSQDDVRENICRSFPKSYSVAEVKGLIGEGKGKHSMELSVDNIKLRNSEILSKMMPYEKRNSDTIYVEFLEKRYNCQMHNKSLQKLTKQQLCEITTTDDYKAFIGNEEFDFENDENQEGIISIKEVRKYIIHFNNEKISIVFPLENTVRQLIQEFKKSIGKYDEIHLYVGKSLKKKLMDHICLRDLAIDEDLYAKLPQKDSKTIKLEYNGREFNKNKIEKFETIDHLYYRLRNRSKEVKNVILPEHFLLYKGDQLLMHDQIISEVLEIKTDRIEIKDMAKTQKIIILKYYLPEGGDKPYTRSCPLDSRTTVQDVLDILTDITKVSTFSLYYDDHILEPLIENGKNKIKEKRLLFECLPNNIKEVELVAKKADLGIDEVRFIGESSEFIEKINSNDDYEEIISRIMQKSHFQDSQKIYLLINGKIRTADNFILSQTIYVITDKKMDQSLLTQTITGPNLAMKPVNAPVPTKKYINANNPNDIIEIPDDENHRTTEQFRAEIAKSLNRRIDNVRIFISEDMYPNFDPTKLNDIIVV